MRHTEHSLEVTLKGLTKTPYTALLSRKAAEEVLAVIRRFSAKDMLPVTKVLPMLADPVEGPATVLRGARHREGLTQKELAAKLDIRQHHLSEMENGKRPIGKEMAKKLSKVLRISDYRVFL